METYWEALIIDILPNVVPHWDIAPEAPHTTLAISSRYQGLEEGGEISKAFTFSNELGLLHYTQINDWSNYIV